MTKKHTPKIKRKHNQPSTHTNSQVKHLLDIMSLEFALRGIGYDIRDEKSRKNRESLKKKARKMHVRLMKLKKKGV